MKSQLIISEQVDSQHAFRLMIEKGKVVVDSYL